MNGVINVIMGGLVARGKIQYKPKSLYSSNS